MSRLARWVRSNTDIFTWVALVAGVVFICVLVLAFGTR